MVGCCSPKYTSRQLRESVAIQSLTRTADGMGGFTEAWQAVTGAPTRAMIDAAPGSERWGYMRQVPGNTYRMVTRYFAGATASQRVIWRGKEYGVLGVVDPDGRQDWLEWRMGDGVGS
jgi:SPP1 family predicted phage head-tail adaptor